MLGWWGFSTDVNYRAVCKGVGGFSTDLKPFRSIVCNFGSIFNANNFPRNARVYNHTSRFTLYVVCIPLLLNNAGGECTQFTCRTIFCCCAFIFWHLIVDCNCLVLHFYIRFIRVLCEIIIGKEITCVCLSVCHTKIYMYHTLPVW